MNTYLFILYVLYVPVTLKIYKIAIIKQGFFREKENDFGIKINAPTLLIEKDIYPEKIEFWDRFSRHPLLHQVQQALHTLKAKALSISIF